MYGGLEAYYSHVYHPIFGNVILMLIIVFFVEEDKINQVVILCISKSSKVNHNYTVLRN